MGCGAPRGRSCTWLKATLFPDQSFGRRDTPPCVSTQTHTTLSSVFWEWGLLTNSSSGYRSLSLIPLGGVLNSWGVETGPTFCLSASGGWALAVLGNPNCSWLPGKHSGRTVEAVLWVTSVEVARQWSWEGPMDQRLRGSHVLLSHKKGSPTLSQAKRQ